MHRHLTPTTVDTFLPYTVRQVDVERVKRQLLAEGVELEEFGGTVQAVQTAATAGAGLRELEEALLLQARSRTFVPRPCPHLSVGWRCCDVKPSPEQHVRHFKCPKACLLVRLLGRCSRKISPKASDTSWACCDLSRSVLDLPCMSGPATLVQADMMELKASRSRDAEAVVVEARMDKGQGPIATVSKRHPHKSSTELWHSEIVTTLKMRLLRWLSMISCAVPSFPALAPRNQPRTALCICGCITQTLRQTSEAIGATMALGWKRRSC